MTNDRTGLWLYAVAADRPALAGVTGVAGAAVRSVDAGALVAVASPVDLGEFGEAGLKRNLEDLDWLAGTAQAHDRVVAAVTSAVTAVPLRLATVFHDEPGVRRLLADRAPDFQAALELLAGRTEWGVKAYADPNRLAAPVAAAPAAAGAGTAYLLRRREQLSAHEQAVRAAGEYAQRVHDALSEIAAAARRYPPQDRKLSGQRDWMVLNGAYLVDDARAGELAGGVERLRAELPSVRLELTGPWSPYSFAGMEWEPR